MPDKYYLVESGALEKLLRTHFRFHRSKKRLNGSAYRLRSYGLYLRDQ